MSDKMREAIVDAYRCGVAHGKSFPDLTGVKLAVAVEDYLCRPEVIVALTQQPESEPAVSCSYGQNCEHCEPGHGCRPDRPESEPAACFIMSDSGWPMAVCYDRDMMARLQKDSGGLTIKWLHEHSRPSAQVPDGIKRYDISSDAFSGDMEESATGSWVRLADVKESLTAAPSIAEKPQPNKENQND